LCLGAAVAVLLVVLPAPAAHAHVFLTRSNPASGATVAPPAAVRLWFSEDVEAGTARLVGPSGRPVGGTRVVPSDDRRLLVLSLPRLGNGTFAVPWRVRHDEHSASGTLVFTVGAVAEPAIGPAWRWAWLGLLAVLVGALVTRRRVLALWCAGIGVLVGLAELGWAVARLGGPASGWWATRAGHLWTARELALVVLVVALSALVDGRSRARPHVVAAVVATLTLVGVEVFAVTGPGRAEPGQAVTSTGSAGDLVVTITATPNRPGVNGFTVTATSARRPPPAPVDGVRLEFSVGGRRSVVVLREIGPDQYFATASLDAPGPTRIDAVLGRAGDLVTVPVAWRLSP
jgi:methionine-rich copper-binding protein CopC